MEVKVYGTAGCGYCDATQAWLNDNNISYEYISLDDATNRREFYEEYNATTVPQIFIDNEPIGGYNQLMSLRPILLGR